MDQLWPSEVKTKVTQSCPTLCHPIDYPVHGILQTRILEWVAFLFSRGSSHQGIKPRSPTLQEDSLSAELQGKPKNTGVGSLSLLQMTFLTQESNEGFLNCRQIFLPMSYQRSSGPGKLAHFTAIQWSATAFSLRPEPQPGEGPPSQVSCSLSTLP